MLWKAFRPRRYGISEKCVQLRIEGAKVMTRLAAGGMAVAGSSSGLGISKKLVLWSVLLLQLTFIFCVWLLQTDYNLHDTNPTGGNVGGNTWKDASRQAVNFIKQIDAKYARQTQKLELAKQHIRLENVNRYDNDFLQMQLIRLNRTAAEYEMAFDVADNENPTQLWCFREGTLNESRTAAAPAAAAADELNWYLQQQCNCAPGWHGKDCGQPEIIWRALMAHSRRGSASDGSGSAALQLREASIATLHRLYYMLEFSYLSLDLLELQIRNVIGVVDYYLIYYIGRHQTESVTAKTLTRYLDEILANANYFLYYCQQWTTNCSTATAYSHLRRQMSKLTGIPPKSTDLIVYSNVPAILVPQTLKFLKYYASDVMPLRFRLKHNVYGFFWQHPAQTQLSVVISSFIHLHNPQYGRSDPLRLQRKAQQRAVLTLGDLNHFGGWFCEFCLQPEEIVSMLQTVYSSLNTRIQFPNVTRNQHIDAGYMQQLIAQGGYLLDTKTQLLKLHRYTDKYFAPKYSLEKNAKFAFLLVNLYATLDDVMDDVDDTAIY